MARPKKITPPEILDPVAEVLGEVEALPASLQPATPVCAPHPQIAYDLAEKFNANIVGVDEYSATLRRGDVVISANITQGYDVAEASFSQYFGL